NNRTKPGKAILARIHITPPSHLTAGRTAGRRFRRQAATEQQTTSLHRQYTPRLNHLSSRRLRNTGRPAVIAQSPITQSINSPLSPKPSIISPNTSTTNTGTSTMLDDIRAFLEQFARRLLTVDFLLQIGLFGLILLIALATRNLLRRQVERVEARLRRVGIVAEQFPWSVDLLVALGASIFPLVVWL